MKGMGSGGHGGEKPAKMPMGPKTGPKMMPKMEGMKMPTPEQAEKDCKMMAKTGVIK